MNLIRYFRYLYLSTCTVVPFFRISIFLRTYGIVTSLTVGDSCLISCYVQSFYACCSRQFCYGCFDSCVVVVVASTSAWQSGVNSVCCSVCTVLLKRGGREGVKGGDFYVYSAFRMYSYNK